MLEFTIDHGYQGAQTGDTGRPSQSYESTTAAFIPATTNLSGLPTEILLSIAEYLPRQEDVASLVYQNRRLHYLFRGILLRRNVEDRGSRAMFWAAERNLTGLAKELLEAGADVEAVIEGISSLYHRRTPLTEACRNGSTEMVELLLDAGANICGASHDPRTFYAVRNALYVAITYRQVEICHVLLFKLSVYEVGQRMSRGGPTPVQLAAQYGLPTVMTHLLQKDAGLGCTSREYWPIPWCTPLQLCLQGDWGNVKGQDDYLQTTMLLLENWDDREPDFVRISYDNRYPGSPHLIRFKDAKYWKGFSDPTLLGRYHSDPRVRVLFSRDEFPFKSRGVGPRPPGYWMTGITEREEERILQSDPAEALFDLGMFKIDRETRKLRLDKPFPPPARPSNIADFRSKKQERHCKCVRVVDMVFAGRNCARYCPGLKDGASR
jgi:hypothetical protein